MAKTYEEYLSQFSSLFKTKKKLQEFLEYDNIDTRIDILKYYAPKVPKKKNKNKNRRDIGHRVFSEYVRLYYCDDKGYCNCKTCNERMFWTVAQAGHFISRTTSKYTFDLTNVYPQCERCNVILSGNYIYYTLNMIDEYGIDFVRDRNNDKSICEIKQGDYEEMIPKRYEFIQEKKKIIEGNTVVKNYDNLKF